MQYKQRVERHSRGQLYISLVDKRKGSLCHSDLVFDGSIELSFEASESGRLIVLDVKIVIVEALHVHLVVFGVAIVTLLAEQRCDRAIADDRRGRDPTLQSAVAT